MAAKVASDCCEAPVEYGWTRAGETSPPEPIAVCSECERKCDTVVISDPEGDTSSQGGFVMKIWNRLSAKTRGRIICAGGYVVWIVVLWFLGKRHMMTPGEAFFGLAALTAVYAAIFAIVKSKILGKRF